MKVAYVIQKRFTGGRFYRVGHYKIYRIDSEEMYLKEMTYEVAKEGEYRRDSNKLEIKITQGGLDGWRDLEQWLIKNRGADSNFIYHIDG